MIFINAKGTQGEVTNDLAGVIDVMNQELNQANSLATKLVREIDYYNQDPKRKRELMDYATKLEDERQIGKKQGERESAVRSVKAVIFSMGKKGAERRFIFEVAKGAANGELTDQQINTLIDELKQSADWVDRIK